MVIQMEPCNGMRSEPTGFVFANCSRARRVKCIGVKAYRQRYREQEGLTVLHPTGKTSHYFGSDLRAVFGFNEVA